MVKWVLLDETDVYKGIKITYTNGDIGNLTGKHHSFEVYLNCE